VTGNWREKTVKEKKKKGERKKKEGWQHSSVSNYNKQERSNFKTFANGKGECERA